MSHPIERIAPRLHASISEFSDFFFCYTWKINRRREKYAAKGNNINITHHFEIHKDEFVSNFFFLSFSPPAHWTSWKYEGFRSANHLVPSGI